MTRGRTVDRREFLVLASGVAAASGCSAAPVPPAEVGNVAAGNVSALRLGSLHVIDDRAVCIGRDLRGVYAMTLTCTHEGCDIGKHGTVSPDGLVCSCHGSRFDSNGNVLSGPATAPLDHFDVTADALGNLTVHGDQVVDSSHRLDVV
jgi:Rieske Fe-S protein